MWVFRGCGMRANQQISVANMKNSLTMWVCTDRNAHYETAAVKGTLTVVM